MSIEVLEGCLPQAFLDWWADNRQEPILELWREGKAGSIEPFEVTVEVARNWMDDDCRQGCGTISLALCHVLTAGMAPSLPVVSSPLMEDTRVFCCLLCDLHYSCPQGDLYVLRGLEKIWSVLNEVFHSPVLTGTNYLFDLVQYQECAELYRRMYHQIPCAYLTDRTDGKCTDCKHVLDARRLRKLATTLKDKLGSCPFAIDCEPLALAWSKLPTIPGVCYVLTNCPRYHGKMKEDVRLPTVWLELTVDRRRQPKST